MNVGKLKVFIIVFSIITCLGSFNICEAVSLWDTPTDTHVSIYLSGSPHLLKLQDGRTMLTYFFKGSDPSTYIYYMISDGNLWTPAIRIENTYRGFDPTVTQNPSTGEIIVAYAKYEDSPSPYKASIYITKIAQTLLDQYVVDCSENYNWHWSIPQRVVNSGSTECLDNNCGYADDIVPSIFAVQDNYNVKLMIVYAHGWEPLKYGIDKQTARLRVVESHNGGNSWSPWRGVYESSNIEYYDSKPSCTEFGFGKYDILCSFYIRDRSTANKDAQYGNSGIFTIRSTDWGVSWFNATTIVPIENYEHKWPFLLNDGNEMFIAYTTEEDETGDDDFIIKILRSIDNGYHWEINLLDLEMEPQALVSESWPSLARRYDALYGQYGITAVWDNDPWKPYVRDRYRIYRSNLRNYIHITSPNGRENWTALTQQKIKWNYSFTALSVGVYINRNYPAPTWSTIVSSIANFGSYTWTVTFPSCINTCRIKVSGGSDYDMSDANFTIK